jgi:carboxyl-terminal processing protease
VRASFIASLSHLVLLSAIASAAGIDQSPPAQDTQASQTTSVVATTYLNYVLDLMQQKALHSAEIDWPAVRRETLKRASGAQTTMDTYAAIYFALTQLKEHHSFLKVPDNLSDSDKQRTTSAMNSILGPYRRQYPKPLDSPFRNREAPSGHLIQYGDLTLALVVIPSCGAKHSEWADNLADFQNYADSLHKIAVELESGHLDGWIVDLRGNGGGNMWPMLAGIGFVLGEGHLGSFVFPNGNVSDWFYRQGKAMVKAGGDEIVISEIKEPPLALAKLPPVAVLIDSGTVSSGEAVAISFAGRPLERSFGARTAGFSTSNERVPLSDGATLFLNSAFEADRLHRRYDAGIEPDLSFPEPTDVPTEASDPVIQAAEKWLASIKSK